MNPAINAKLEALRAHLVESDDPSTEAHAEAGRVLQAALDDLRDRSSELAEDIRDLEKAWSNWDLSYLAKKRYLSASLISAMKKERGDSDAWKGVGMKESATSGLVGSILLPTVQNLAKYIASDDKKAIRAGLKMVLGAMGSVLDSLGEDSAAGHLKMASKALNKDTP